MRGGFTCLTFSRGVVGAVEENKKYKRICKSNTIYNTSHTIKYKMFKMNKDIYLTLIATIYSILEKGSNICITNIWQQTPMLYTYAVLQKHNNIYKGIKVKDSMQSCK